MITLTDIKETLNWELSDTSKDALIQKTIDRVVDFIKIYTNNPNLPDTPALDDIYLHLATRRLNDDTKNRAGKESETVGNVSYTFSKSDLTDEIKKILDYFTIKTSTSGTLGTANWW